MLRLRRQRDDTAGADGCRAAIRRTSHGRRTESIDDVANAPHRAPHARRRGVGDWREGGGPIACGPGYPGPRSGDGGRRGARLADGPDRRVRRLGGRREGVRAARRPARGRPRRRPLATGDGRGVRRDRSHGRCPGVLWDASLAKAAGHEPSVMYRGTAPLDFTGITAWVTDGRKRRLKQHPSTSRVEPRPAARIGGWSRARARQHLGRDPHSWSRHLATRAPHRLA